MGAQEDKKKIFVSKFPHILVVVSKFSRFSTITEVKTKKKGLRLKISTNSGCQLKISAILGVLGLDLHPSSPEFVNFFGARSSLGGAQAVIWGARPQNAPPWCRAWFEAFSFYDFTRLVSLVKALFSGPHMETFCLCHWVQILILFENLLAFKIFCFSLALSSQHSASKVIAKIENLGFKSWLRVSNVGSINCHC